MSLFSKILEKLRFHSARRRDRPRPDGCAAAETPLRRPDHGGRCHGQAGRPRCSKPSEAQLEGVDRRPAEASGSRQQLCGAQGLATELGCPADKMAISAQ